MEELQVAMTKLVKLQIKQQEQQQCTEEQYDYQSFIPKMHKLRAPLNQLLKKDKHWEWTTECQAAFEEIKKILTSNLFLSHFNPELDIIVASDTSQYGIGACLLHIMPDGSKQPIAFTSRTLLPVEKHYSQIEKEGLLCCFKISLLPI